MHKVFDFLMQHKNEFPQVAEFDGFDTRFSEAMLFDHMPAVVLDMINNYKYIPELIVVNVEDLDFMKFTSSQQRVNIKKMVITYKALIKQVVSPTDNFRVFFFNLMILLPWYVGWQSQRAARHARSHFNGCLASMVWYHGCYMICHDGIYAPIGEGLFDTDHYDDLSNIGISMFLADIVLLIKHIYQPFQVAQEAIALPFRMLKAIKSRICKQQCKAFTWMINITFVICLLLNN